jgi:hypothetical protein
MTHSMAHLDSALDGVEDNFKRVYMCSKGAFCVKDLNWGRLRLRKGGVAT